MDRDQFPNTFNAVVAFLSGERWASSLTINHSMEYYLCVTIQLQMLGTVQALQYTFLKDLPLSPHHLYFTDAKLYIFVV
jgi:hypothetical protein